MKKLFLFFTFFIFFLVASGASASSLVILEDVQEIDLVPGGADHFSVKIKNETGSDLEVMPEVRSFKFSSDGKEIELIDNGDNPLVDSWIKPLNSSGLKIRSGSEGKATFLVTVPQIVENKGYYAAVYVVGKNKEGEGYKSNNSLLLLGVEKEDSNAMLRGGEITSLMAPEKVYYGPIDFDIEFENTGKIHYKTNGEIEIFNFLNKKVETIQVEEKTVLPGSKISLKANWGRRYFMGRYLVVTKMVDGDGNDSVLTGQFWAAPWKELTAIFIVVILYFLIKKLRKRRLSFE